MNEGSTSLVALINKLADESERLKTANNIAMLLGAKAFYLYVQDPELQVMLPATGMLKTLRVGRSWRELLARCITEQQVCAEVELESAVWEARAITESGCAFLLVGRQLPQFPPELLIALPLLAAVLRGQQALQIGMAAAKDALEAAARAHQLATALDGARAAAADLNRQLQDEHRQKDEFLAMLAHELRNPLAPLSSAVEIMRRTPGQARDDSLLALMARQLQQLSHLVDDLLDVSRVSRGQIELRRETLMLDEVIAAAVESSKPLIDTRRLILHLDVEFNCCWVNGDRVRLTQIISNLLNNAAKYTEPNGRIDVRVRNKLDSVELSVSDTGAGIPRNMLESIFDLFTQVPGSLDKAPGGLGIGLTLVRTLVRLHGGTIYAESAGPGHGSTFTVLLPLVSPPQLMTREPAAQMVSSSGVRVLIVDDNEDAALALAELLRVMGAHASVAHDGPQALAQATGGRKFDMVLLDIGLPGMDGYEIAREWRRRFGAESRLIALTGYGSAEDKRRSSHAGFDRHLVKPIPIEALQSMLAEVVSGRTGAKED